MTFHLSFRIKNNRYGFCIVVMEDDYTIIRGTIIFGFYVLGGSRFSDSKKIIEWRIPCDNSKRS